MKQSQSCDFQVLRACIVSFNENPRFAPSLQDACAIYHDGVVCVNDHGRIAWVGAYQDMPDLFKQWPQHYLHPKIITAGFIDAHVHFPQYRMLAAPALDVLEWLKRYTFKEEIKYEDGDYAATAANIFLHRLYEHGTTAALVFSTSHFEATEQLFMAASLRNMAIATSNVMMDRNAPLELCDTAQSGADRTLELIKKWHGNQRARVAITLRFAITSSQEQLAAAGAIYQSHPECLFQTHLAESKAEVKAVKELFPWAKHYSDVYDHFGLLASKSIFAHAIYLSKAEQELLYDKQCSLVHCPTSNSFLGSGLFHIDQITQAGIPTGLASDIGGGLHYSMLVTMAEAYKVACIQKLAFNVWDGFYMATLGNARLMHCDDEIGSLEIGKWADLIVLDPQATPVLASRDEISDTIEERLFSLMMLGDDRAVDATMVAGKWFKQTKGN